MNQRLGRAFLLALPVVLLLVGAPACEPEPVQVTVPLGAEELSGVYWEPKEALAPGLLLLPMQGGEPGDWRLLARRLHEEGYGVLALHFREQGRTGRDALLADTRAAFRFLRDQEKIDSARIALIGADVGANVALAFAAREPLVPLVVLLSPGRTYRSVPALPALRDYGARPLLLLAAEQDLGSASAVRQLARAAARDVVVKLYPGDAHGTDLLQPDAPAVADLITFLRGRLGVR